MHNTVTATELDTRLKRGDRIQLIDVRSGQEYAEGHVPGAMNLPLEQVESRLDDMGKHDPVVLICQNGRRAGMACETLTPHRSDVSILTGGTIAWKEAGLPVVASVATRLPLMRQVQLVAGLMALIGAALALTVDTRWAFLSGFVWAGLTLAGSTGFCGMAIILGKMPWNRAKAATSATASCCN